jgi:hypothetical protein
MDPKSQMEPDERRTHSFRRGDSPAHRDLRGSATLQPLEPNICLTFTGDGKGHIGVKGIARNNFVSRTELRFDLTIDQTYLKEIASSLTEADPA